MMLARTLPTVPPVSELRRELDRVFDGFLGTRFAPPRQRAFPALNAWEDGNRMFVEAEVPGLAMEDLDIQIQGNELTIRGQRKPVESNVVYHRRERGTGEFTRFVTLPVEVDADNVEAALKDGVLTIILPKAEKARARRIEVKST